MLLIHVSMEGPVWIRSATTSASVCQDLKARIVKMTSMNVSPTPARMEPSAKIMSTPTPAHVQVDFLVETVRRMTMIVQPHLA